MALFACQCLSLLSCQCFHRVPEKEGSREVGLGLCKEDWVYRSATVIWILGSY